MVELRPSAVVCGTPQELPPSPCQSVGVAQSAPPYPMTQVHAPLASTTPCPVQVSASLNSQLAPAKPAAQASQLAPPYPMKQVHAPLTSTTPCPVQVSASLNSQLGPA